MNIIQSLLQRRDNRRREEITRAVSDDVQVREFQGRLYLAYRGTPLVEQSLLQTCITRAVEDARHVATLHQLDREHLKA